MAISIDTKSDTGKIIELKSEMVLGGWEYQTTVCKTAIHQFESGCRLQNIIKGLSVYSFTYKLFFYCLL